MRPLLPILLTLLLASAGCIGASDDLETADTSRDENGMAAAAVVRAPEEAINASDAAAMREVPMQWGGKLGRSFCAPTGPGSCMGAGFGDDSFHILDEPGVRSLDLVLSWEAETPLTSSLTFSAFVVKPCGDRCYEWVDKPSADAEGASPLALTLAGIDLAADEAVAIAVSTGSECAFVVLVYGCASASEQPFRVDGILRVA